MDKKGDEAVKQHTKYLLPNCWQPNWRELIEYWPRLLQMLPGTAWTESSQQLFLNAKPWKHSSQ